MFEDGIAAAVNLLSTRAPATLGECSASALVPVGGPTASARLYIDAMPEGEGTFADGVQAAIDLLTKFKVARGPNGWALVETDIPTIDAQLFIVELHRLLEERS